MVEMDSVGAHDQEAARYDQQVRDCRSHVHDVLFGLAFEYVKSREMMLDLGIGTGLASWPFAKTGLHVYGLDGSAEMLKVCESKEFAEELRQFDLRNMPLPYFDDSFHHAICCGVFHFFGELGPIISETSRVIKPGGMFAFTIASPTPEEQADSSDNSTGYVTQPTACGVSIYAHSDRYIREALHCVGFEPLKTQKIMTSSGEEVTDDLLFEVVVARNSRR
jgi:predicted TPR repeat methyltransferase